MEERSLLAAAPQQEEEAPALLLHDTTLLAAAACSLPVAQRQVVFLPYEGDESDGSDYTGLALEAQPADSDLDLADALDGAAAELDGAPEPRHQPLGVLALRCALHLRGTPRVALNLPTSYHITLNVPLTLNGDVRALCQIPCQIDECQHTPRRGRS